MSTITRRNFGKSAALAGVSTALGSSRVLGANERIRLGFIGLGNRGDQVLDAFLEHKDCEVAAICDIYQPYLDFAAKKIGSSPKQFTDYRTAPRTQGRGRRRDRHARPLARPADDPRLPGGQRRLRREAAVAVRRGGPAHGRGRPQARKRVTQVGLHRRSSDFCREAAEFVRKGGIGKVTAVRAFHIQNEWPHGIGNPAGREAARRTSTGTPGSARPRSCPTTRTAPSTASAGSTTTPAANSRTSASTTST